MISLQTYRHAPATGSVDAPYADNGGSTASSLEPGRVRASRSSSTSTATKDRDSSSLPCRRRVRDEGPGAARDNSVHTTFEAPPATPWRIFLRLGRHRRHHVEPLLHAPPATLRRIPRTSRRCRSHDHDRAGRRACGDVGDGRVTASDALSGRTHRARYARGLRRPRAT